jgi:type I restriction enzyme S subunit
MKHPAVALGEIADLIRGITYKPADVCDPNAASAVACMRTKNVQEALDESDIVWIPDSLIRNPAKYLKPGDILVSSANSWNLVGKGCWVPELNYPASAGGFISILRGNSDAVDLRYLYHWFVSPQTQAKLRSYSNKTTNISNLDHGRTLATEIPLPPLEEQRRIAAILDTVALVSTYIDRAANLRLALKRSLFADLFRLSAQPAVTIGSDLPPSDSGWHWRLLTDVARLATGHTPDRSNKSYWGGDVPWITLGDIRELDGTWATSTKEMTTPEGIVNSSAVLLPKGTVCFSRTASVGFSTIMGREMGTSQDFVNWVCGPDLLPEYLMNALIFSRARLRGLSTGSTHKTIYFSTVEQFRVLLPPVELQTRFCQLIRRVDSMPLGKLSELANDLRSSLTSKLFSPAHQ